MMRKELLMKMRTGFFAIGVIALVGNGVLVAQTSETFFPRHIGDRWDYVYSVGGFIGPLRLTRDSIATDGSHSLFYNRATDPTYRIDTMLSVFRYPQVVGLNYLRYKLAADSGSSWEQPRFKAIRWAWVARVESAFVFGRRTLKKVYRYAPGPPSLGYLEEDWVAAGFGLIYTYREPNEFSYLRGCVIAGDTFGVVTSLPEEEDIPANISLKPNYPNPFNSSTTVFVSLPNQSAFSLKIFDLFGRQVEVLAEGNYARGVHRFTWNAIRFASGVYFCQMQGKGHVHTIKMLLTK
jgi:hypothetical protein